jgi:hypothetical protein
MSEQTVSRKSSRRESATLAFGQASLEVSTSESSDAEAVNVFKRRRRQCPPLTLIA